MALTAAGARATERYRAQQLAIRAGSLRDLVRLWRTVDPTDLTGTIDTFAHAAALLAGRGFDESGRSAADFYPVFRRAERVRTPPPTVRRTLAPAVETLAGEIRGSALSGIIQARRSGLSVAGAAQQGLVRTLGTLGKLILTGGRMTLISAVREDPVAIGWARVTAGGACAFCRMLASRGAAYKTERSADFETHGACACTVEPLYDDAGLPAQAKTYQKEWRDAQAWARESGTLSKGTSNDALNTYRRYLAAGKPTAPGAGTEESG